MSDEQREAARLARRDVVDSNKAWAASIDVRAAHLTALTARKSPPKGSTRFVAEIVLTCGSLLGRFEWRQTFAQAVTGSVAGRPVKALDTASDKRAEALTLAACLHACEAATTGSFVAARRPDYRRVPAVPREQRLRPVRRGAAGLR